MAIIADDVTDVPEPERDAAPREPRRRPPAMPAHCSFEGQVLSRPDIESRFPSEWVLIGEPELDEHLGVVRGTILWHSKDRDEVDWKDMELHPASAAYLYIDTGDDNDETIIL
jgi:hypothetical protein